MSRKKRIEIKKRQKLKKRQRMKKLVKLGQNISEYYRSGFYIGPTGKK